MKKLHVMGFDFQKLAASFRKEIEEYGALLGMIYEQQNCLMYSLQQETSKIEAQLPANQLATADRSAMVEQLAEELHRKELPLCEVPNVVPNELQVLFKALVDEIVNLRLRIKNKMQFQQNLLKQVQMINLSVVQQVSSNINFDENI